jgi:hypothetical protein
MNAVTEGVSSGRQGKMQLPESGQLVPVETVSMAEANQSELWTEGEHFKSICNTETNQGNRNSGE